MNSSAVNTKSPGRAGLTLVIALLASIYGILNARTIGAPLLFGVAWGLIWTTIAAIVATRIGRVRSRLVHAPDAAALLPAFSNTMLLTGGLLLHAMFGSPEAYFNVQASGAGAGTFLFYAILNPLTEWVLVPLAVFLNLGETGRRKLVLAAAVVYYVERLSTYL